METKICATCKEELPVELFSTRNDKKKLTYQSSCKKCHKEYRRKHYEANIEKYKEKAKVHTKKVVDWFNDEIKEKLKCEVCGEDRTWVLDFHHLDPSQKDAHVSVLTRRGSKRKLLEEIKKCKVLCSNCHRDLHYKEKQASNA